MTAKAHSFAMNKGKIATNKIQYSSKKTKTYEKTNNLFGGTLRHRSPLGK